MSVNDNIEFLNTLLVTDPRMSQLSIKWINQLSKYDNLISEFKKVYAKYPYLGSMGAILWVTIKLKYNPHVMEDLSLLELMGVAFKSPDSFRMWHSRTICMHIDRLYAELPNGLHSDIRYLVPPNTVAVDLGELSINFIDGMMNLYERGKYIGNVMEYPEIEVNAGLIKIKACTYFKFENMDGAVTYRLGLGKGKLCVVDTSGSSPLIGYSLCAKYRGYLDCRLVIIPRKKR